MSHNHEPERAARRHKPAIIAIAVALLAALVAFWVFRPGVPAEGGDGLATTPPPATAPLTEADGTDGVTDVPTVPDADTPASVDQPAGTIDLPAGAEPEPTPAVPATPAN